MDFIESSVCRLQENVRRFIVPSAEVCDAPTLRAQIALRQNALTDIEIIRCRLRPFLRGENPRRYGKSCERRARRSPVGSRRRCN
jgi:hypothetical protein